MVFDVDFVPICIYEVFQGLVRIPIPIKKLKRDDMECSDMRCGHYSNTQGLIAFLRQNWGNSFVRFPSSMKCFDVVDDTCGT